MFLAVQWLGLHAPNAGGTDLILGQGTQILHATWAANGNNKHYITMVYFINFQSCILAFRFLFLCFTPIKDTFILKNG